MPDVRPLVEAWSKAEGIERPTDAVIANFYFPMARWIADHAGGHTLVAGLSGAPGTGKSALARLMKRLLETHFGIRAAVLSLDDLYLGRDARLDRAATIHPLLATRGVPGTHDVTLGLEVIASLRKGRTTALPRFDKAADDPRPEHEWPLWEGRCDVVLFEGWCVGARSQPNHSLDAPVNGLERLEDSDGGWRWYVNRQLGGPYQRLFAEIDLLMLLRPRDFDTVFSWREDQEARLRASRSGEGVMTPSGVRRFVMHFERLTRFMWEEMPGRAEAVVFLGADHTPEEVVLGDR